MGTTVDTADLMSASEVADLLGLAQHNSVTTYLNRYKDFPRPVVNKSGGRVRLWLRHDVEAWDATRKGTRR
jgi:predicted DNA-binding transcriptional regulator AlpA